jgi:2,4-dienoyl-CoA reductase-like NADH-dependent reductase (Old Yellow Enzyme family)
MLRFRGFVKSSSRREKRIRLGEILVSILFEPTILKGMSLANRFVRSATWEGMATSDGICTGRLTETMARLAEGGVGLIITGHAYVSREGQGKYPPAEPGALLCEPLKAAERSL